MPVAADITHDAASLNKFVDSIRGLCDLRRGFPSYLDGSREFLSLIENLADATKKYLSTFQTNAPTDPGDYQVYRQELRTLRFAWFQIHQYVKPVADADTLHVPGPLVNAMTARLRSLTPFRTSKLAILHIRELNYLQVVGSGIRDTITRIADFVGSVHSFPADLGLIGIPYSQADAILLNSLIAHELGHFVFENRKIKDDLAPKIQAALNAAFSPAAPVLVSNPTDFLRIPSALGMWTEELFCDLFAIQFVGPCYSYAFVELFDLASYLGHDGSLALDAGDPPLQFSQTYPAYLYRVKKQVELLQTIGWWQHIESSTSTSQQLLTQASAIPAANFKFPFTPALHQYFVECLDLVVPEIIAALNKALTGLDPGVGEYDALKDVVMEYLLEGVVPSTIQNPVSGDTRVPSFVTVLNVAFQLCLDKLPKLIGRIEGQKPDSVEHQTRWIERVEQWTLKALEDISLLSGRLET